MLCELAIYILLPERRLEVYLYLAMTGVSAQTTNRNDRLFRRLIRPSTQTVAVGWRAAPREILP